MFEMKRNILYIALSVFVFFVACGQKGNPASDFEYTENEGKITIKNYIGESKDVVIPPKINKMPVVAIGYEAFKYKQLTGITLPNSVTHIGDLALSYNRLTGITLPNSVIHIGDFAFVYNQLASITLPDSVIHIGDLAFSDNQLTSITLPNSVIYIGGLAFSSNQLTSITLPDSVTHIGDWAFSYNQLTSVTLPDNVDIQPNSFYFSLYDKYIKNGKTKSIFNILLSTVNDFEVAILDNSVVEILKYSGSDTDVRIPEIINKWPVVIRGLAFCDNQLTSITLPDSVTHIGDRAFSFNQLTSITLPDSVTYIGEGAFRNNQLTGVIIPNSVEYLGDNAFDPDVIIVRE
jgi:hypothetical protein